jgi:predicted flap endonuclease-1-like 5' DNA nuclease
MSETTSGKTQKIWLISAIAGIVAFLALIYVAEYSTAASLIVGVLVALLVGILLWIGWYEDPEAEIKSVERDVAQKAAVAAASDATAADIAATSAKARTSVGDEMASTVTTPSAALDMNAAATTSASVAEAAPVVKTAAPKTAAKKVTAKTTTAKTATTKTAAVKKTVAPKATAKPAAKKAEAKPVAAKVVAKPAAKKTTAKSADATKDTAVKSKAATKAPAKAAVAKKAPVAKDGKPPVLTAARGGVADDLKLLKGVGPKLEQTLNTLGFYHFDQVAGWRKKEIEWVDSNLRFKGRIERDGWVAQAKTLAKGGETEFSKRSKKSAS